MIDRAKRKAANDKWRASEAGKAWLAGYAERRKAKVSERNKNYHAKHRDKLNPARRERRAKRRKDPVDGPLHARKRMLADARGRAAERGIDFSITLADVGQPERCPVFGMSLAWARTKHGPDSPSLDRVVPSLGYVPGNVWVISRRANVIKNDATPAELRAVADAVDAKLRGCRAFPEAGR